MSLNKNEDSVIHIPDEQILSSDNGEVNTLHIIYDSDDDASEEPRVSPRVGDQYQAELPPLTREENHISSTNDEQQSVVKFMTRLSLPLTCIECHKHEGPQTISVSERPDSNNVVRNGDVQERQKCCHEGNVLVPGLLGASWSDTEKARFLVALYIFQRNFVEVRRLVETKNMGAVLAFYYGDFYKSNEYKKWSEGRKSSKKCVLGEKIFLGLRKQELLSRLIPRVPEECKSGLVEVCTAFREGKSLPGFVSTLKTLVGTDTLVEAIGIGGKQDITRKRKFSRRKLVKGDDCFDSVADVLSVVAKAPELIVLEAETAEENTKDEQNLAKVENEQNFAKVVTEQNLAKVENEQPAEQRQFYLQPRTPTWSLDAIKFTIVDTSLSDGNVRELRTLHSQVSNTHISYGPREDKESDDTTDIPTIRVDVPPASETLQIAVCGGKSSASKVNNNKKPQSVGKKQKQARADNIAPMSKRCKQLTANGNEETRDGVIHESSANLINSSKGSLCASNEPSQPQLLIDLNLPAPEFENDVAINTTNEQSIKQENSALPARIEEQAVADPQRLSTRYRAPTTRTLEAVASGFLSVTRRRKSKDASSSRPSQRSHRGVGPNESPSRSVASHVEVAKRGRSHDPPETHEG